MTSSDTTVKHLEPLLELYYALQEPKVAFLKWRASKGDGPVSRDNNAADAAATATAGYVACKLCATYTRWCKSRIWTSIRQN